MYKLKKTEYARAINLFEDIPWQLSGKAVLAGSNPGQIYLDSLKNPLYGIMLTPEGIIISGNLTGNLANFKSWINNSLLSPKITNAKHILHDKDLVFLHRFKEWDEIKKILRK